MKVRVRGWALVSLLAVAVLAGCADADSNSAAPADGGTVGADNAGAGDVGERSAAAPGAGGAANPLDVAPAQYRQQDRSIVYTGEITVRVTDVDRAAADVVRLASDAGGYVGADQRTSEGSDSAAHLTIRVPPDRFSSTVDRIAAIGKEESRSIKADDVTQQVVDLDAQIASQQASVDRTRALLARAQAVSEIVSIEAELAKRESALAALQARKKRLADLSSLSTITAHLLGPGAPALPDELGFIAGLKAGWRALFAVLKVGVAVLGFLLPFAVALAIPISLILLLVRWRRRSRRATPPGSTAPQAPAPPLPRIPVPQQANAPASGTSG